MKPRTAWAGVDVGGAKKGFHVALVDESGLVEGPLQVNDPEQVVKLLASYHPKVVAIDSPRSCSPPGEKARLSERKFAEAGICGIRWTPEEAKLAGNPYYDWIVRGRALYAALQRVDEVPSWEVIEVFPTASWTIWAGKRGTKRRAAWSREALDALGLAALPSRRLNQDDRDAIAAALTARLFSEGRTRSFGGEIVVPTPPACSRLAHRTHSPQ